MGAIDYVRAAQLRMATRPLNDTIVVGGKTLLVGPTDVKALRANRIQVFKAWAKATGRPWPIADWDEACEARMELLNEEFPIPWPKASNEYDLLFLIDEAAGHENGFSNI